MPKLRNFFLENTGLFIGAFLYFSAGFLFVLFTSKAGGFLMINAYHHPVLDSFFTCFTELGNGLFSIAIVILLLISRRFDMAWPVLFAYSVSGLLSQLLKHLVFSPRPREFFKLREHIYLIDGVTLTGNSSFPSGHASSAFALVTILAICAQNKKLASLLIIPAILVGYSRIYLSQHFPLDVLAGGVIGFLTGLFTYYIFTYHFKRRM